MSHQEEIKDNNTPLGDGGINRYSKTLTQDETQPAAQAMYYAIGMKDEDFKKAQVGIVSMGWDGNPCNMHLNLAEDHIWMIGKKIASGIPRTLHGRADVEAAHVIAQQLAIVPQPEQDNPNHANIVGWPSDKDVRKIRALEIARAARFIPNPEITA